jgi:hypothetical protein
MQEMIIFLETVSQTDPLLELDFPIDPAVGMECHLSSLGGETQMDPFEFGISDRSASIRHCPGKGVLSREGAERTHASRHRGSTTLLLTRTDLQTSGLRARTDPNFEFESQMDQLLEVRFSNSILLSRPNLPIDPLSSSILRSIHFRSFDP